MPGPAVLIIALDGDSKHISGISLWYFVHLIMMYGGVCMQIRY